MSRYELSLSFNYVSSWTYVEAVREIFQNALDAQIVNPENAMFIEFDAENQVLRIGNKAGVLERKTLLLGASSKQNDETTIGQFGEGYKIATVVLLREGLNLTIYNYSKKEVWRAKSVKSRRYGSDVPAFDIEQYIFKSVPDNNLVFEISGVTQEMYENILKYNLHLRRKEYGEDSIGTIKKGKQGSVLLDEKFKGHIFVNGLFVKVVSSLSYGYDFKPDLIKLDRDRSLIDNFNLKWSIGILMRSIDDVDFLREAVNTPDAEYLYTDYTAMTSTLSKASDAIAEDFVKENGDGAVPCTTTSQFNDTVKSGHKAVMVSSSVMSAVKQSKYYGVSVEKVKTLSEQFSDWYEEAKQYLPNDFVEKHTDLISRVMNQL